MNPKQQHGEQKKQIRRRCKARRPWKERHLNTAEARKEIATALKFHRERQQKQDQQMKQASPLHPCFEYEGRMKSRRNPMIYPYDCSYYLDHLSNFSDVSSYPIAPPLAEKQNLNVELPVQTLGLNLNFHHFISMDNSAVLYNESFPFHQEVPRSITFAQEGELMASGVLDSKLPTGEGEKDSEGTSREQHQEAMERQEELDKKAVEIDDQHNFGEVMEFPDWLSLNDNCLQQHLNYHCSEDNFQDPDLSWMDLGKIEDVVEEDWFA